MPSDRIDGALRDVLHHIDLAIEFAGGLDREAFAADLRTVYAVTRCLEIISEASRRLPEELKARHPAIAWRQMAAAGNVYRHNYEGRCSPSCVGDRSTGPAASQGSGRR
jgi:uncharacterized protein with HEPN domain